MYETLEQQFSKISQLIESSGNILIAAHENPDADAASSVLALHLFFKKQNKNSFPYLPDPAPKNLSFLPGFHEIRHDADVADPDIIFCLDYGDFERLRLPEAFLDRSIVTFDHHTESDQRGEVKVILPELSSTCEVLYSWMEKTNAPIDKDIATCLLAGIVSDSGNFCHATTSAKTLEISAQLILRGAPLAKICRQNASLARSPAACKIWGRVLARLKKDEQKSLAFSCIALKDLEECEAGISDLTGIASMISTVSSAKTVLFLAEYEKGKIKGSLRSEPYKGQNVARLALALGGGGHAYAAAFRAEGTFEETLKKVRNLI